MASLGTRVTKNWWAAALLIAVGSGVFLAALDQTVVVTALPAIMLELHIPVTELDRASWIITGYLLGYTVAMPLMGRVSDAYGHLRIYILALLIFGIGSLLVAMGGSLQWVVTSRVLQAVGGGALVPIAMAVVADRFPPERRGPPLGLLGAAAEVGGVLGPLWGGAIIHLLDWRWVFWINLPLAGALGIALTRRAIGERGNPTPVDYPGGIILAGGLAALALGLGQRHPYLMATGIGGGVALLALFGLHQRRLAFPLVPLSFFSLRPFIAACATHLPVGAALIIAMVTVPLMTDTVMGKEALAGGLVLVRLTAAIPVGAVAGGWLLHRLGNNRTTILGLAAVALGFLALSRWSLEPPEPWATLHLLLAGLGFGLVIAPIGASALSQVAPGDRGTASALVTAMRIIGMTIGLAAVSAWGMGHFETLTAGLPSPFALTEAGQPTYEEQLNLAGLNTFRVFFMSGMGISLAAMVPAWFMGKGDVSPGNEPGKEG